MSSSLSTFGSLLVLAAILGSFRGGGAASCNGTATIRVQITYTWAEANETSSAQYPANAHFSGVVCSSASKPSLFVRDAQASPGFVRIAETGETVLLLDELAANSDVTDIRSLPPTDIGTSVGMRTMSLTVSPNSPYVGCVAMIAPSPDWVVGLPDMNVCDETSGEYVTSFQKLLKPYDAGSDSGSSYTAADSPTSPQGVVAMATEGVIGDYGYVTLSSSPGTSETSEDEGSDGSGSDEAECFPASALVRMRDGSQRMMKDLAIGDEVLVGNGEFSPVFGFTHRDSETGSDFVRVDVQTGQSLWLTPGHYVPVPRRGLVSAGALRVGDAVTLADGTESAVARLSRESLVGLYNPQTVSGDIVVDGVLASTYTTAIEPQIAHALLRPFVYAYRAFGLGLVGLDSGADSMIPSLVL